MRRKGTAPAAKHPATTQGETRRPQPFGLSRPRRKRYTKGFFPVREYTFLEMNPW